MSHSAEKCKRGALWDLLTYILLQNIKKLEGGLFWDNEKFSKKSRTVPKKNRKGDPLVSSGFVGYVKKSKNERGTLCTKFALAGLGLSSFSSFCKKWYTMRSVVWRKRKKTSRCNSRALFTRKAPTKNKPEPARVGAISKAKKLQKEFKVSKYSLLKYLKNPKSWTALARRGDPFAFFNIHSVAKHQKIEGGPFGEMFIFEKTHNAGKTVRVDPQVSPGIVCYAEKDEKPILFNSLSQMIRFGTIKFRRTFKNYFGQFVWIEKSLYNSRVLLHEAPTKKGHCKSRAFFLRRKKRRVKRESKHYVWSLNNIWHFKHFTSLNLLYGVYADSMILYVVCTVYIVCRVL